MKMFEDEIEMTLECAVNVRKHLIRILENRSEHELHEKLHFVNNIILQASTLREHSPAAVQA
ncbi:MAG: hypothetical protein Tsb0034_30750 [Ekhidna sp.]